MSIMKSEYRDRVKHWVRTLRDDFYHELAPIAFEGFTTFEHLTPEQAQAMPARPVEEGMRWGHTWEYMWLKARICMPKEAAGLPVALSLDLSGEATLFVNGRPFGTRRAEWVQVPHHYIEDNFLTQSAVEGEAYDLLFEVYAGHYYPDVGGCATGPVLPGAFEDPTQEGKRATVGHSGFGIWNEDAYQLYMDVMTLGHLLEGVPEDSLRAAQIAGALEAFTRIVDFEQPLEGRIADYRAARERLRPVMQARNGDVAPRMIAVGNAHIDLAWLWPMAETHRKTARTFAQQLRLLERYGEYRFIQSQPASYEMCRTYYPELYARIKEAVARGQWIADGAMYVEPDTNMTGGEALIRQLVHGKRFYKEEFGTDSQMLWLPDTFGYTAALPQILKGCGVKYLVTQKIFWSYNEGDAFPYHYFTWRGMDGSEVTSFLPTSYTYHTDPRQLTQVWKGRAQKRDLDCFLIPFGYGDGGGGPCRDDIEYALREKDIQGMPRVEMAHPVKLFEELEAEGGPVNTWEGELYFSAHRGTYTTQAAIKRGNRKCELALREAEIWGTLASFTPGYAYPLTEMDRQWKALLLHQFHDILPGSSIARVYEEARAAHADILRSVRAVADEACAALAQGEGVTLYNALSWPRRAVVSLPEAFGAGAVTPEGEKIAVLGGMAQVEIPAMGSVSLRPAALEAAAPAAFACALPEGGATLENDVLSVKINAMGEIVSLRRKDSGREFVQGKMNELKMYKDVPRLFDAWDIDSNYIDQPVALEEKAEVTVERAQGLAASVRVRRTVLGSAWEQVISLAAGAQRVEFDTRVGWHELHRLLKVSFAGSARSDMAINEMQFGYVKRPTHRSRLYDKDRFEVCNHRYTALCDEGHGMAVLNESKYGVSVNDNAIELTLLRGAAAPELRADQGEHRFTYAVTVWEGSFLQSGVVREGYELNVPVTLRAGSAARRGALDIDRENIVADTLKPAEDGSGDVILRLYESKRADGEFTLRLHIPAARVWRCDMLENAGEELACTNGVIKLHARPFEIITLRLKRA